jgi:hypothetical protein
MDRKTGASRRNLTWLWIVIVTVVIFLLLYWEQTAILYVLATLGVSALLLIVAKSDLSGARKIASAPLTPDDSAALGSNINEAESTLPTNFGARSSKRRSSRQG